MILVLEDRYESDIFIDTKKVPVALYFNDVRVTKNGILRILDEKIRQNFKFSPKILGICDLHGVFDTQEVLST